MPWGDKDPKVLCLLFLDYIHGILFYFALWYNVEESINESPGRQRKDSFYMHSQLSAVTNG
jgi:hypothetical protein